MSEIRVYTTPICGYCFMAKRLLKASDLPFEEINVAGDTEARRWLVEATGQRTVPQIFIDGKSVGGYRELHALERAGGLDHLEPTDTAS